MKARIEGGEFRVDAVELVQHLSQHDKKQMAQYLCFDEYLLKAIAECVSTGTMFNDDEEAPWWFDRRTVNEIREKLIPLMGDVAREAVREANRQTNEAKHEKRRMERWAWAMYHNWPRDYVRARPELEPWSAPESPDKEGGK